MIETRIRKTDANNPVLLLLFLSINGSLGLFLSYEYVLKNWSKLVGILI